MNGQKVKPENIPKRKREQLAAPLLQIVKEAFEDPAIVQEFKNWQEARKKKGESDERIRMENSGAAI